MSSSLPASSVTTFTGEPNMCPRCGKRVYFGKVASVCACLRVARPCRMAQPCRVAWPHGNGLCAGALGHSGRLGVGFGSERGLRVQRDVPEGPSGMGPLGYTPGCRALSALYPLLCHLPCGNSCPQPSSVTCEAPEGWEGCGRLEILRALLGFYDIPVGNASPWHVAAGWCDPPSLSHSS